VRACVAPEVSGRIVGLSVADDQFVHKGDVLLSIEAAGHAIAVEQAQAALGRMAGRRGDLAKDRRQRNDRADPDRGGAVRSRSRSIVHAQKEPIAT
jgi:multidrug resistance efflux pump